MTLRIKHYLFIAGIVSVFISFLFFGRNHNVYGALILSGIIISGVSFLWIVAGADSVTREMFWPA